MPQSRRTRRNEVVFVILNVSSALHLVKSSLEGVRSQII